MWWVWLLLAFAEATAASVICEEYSGGPSYHGCEVMTNPHRCLPVRQEDCESTFRHGMVSDCPVYHCVSDFKIYFLVKFNSPRSSAPGNILHFLFTTT
jgi:hypothetical protein